ncbi:hypothetical protein FH972_024375 [Carpinus fangiana]|uniref:Uncharacterized protein n=1 Tax=Carpinus fangiana TaxID=176857 RepID=A0A5N6KYR9_9ROSI|nr:hypothetical protein FH972_024375 [Carpinus fangiana]
MADKQQQTRSRPLILPTRGPLRKVSTTSQVSIRPSVGFVDHGDRVPSTKRADSEPAFEHHFASGKAPSPFLEPEYLARLKKAEDAAATAGNTMANTARRN